MLQPHCDRTLEIIVRIRGIIPKWPLIRLVKYYNLPRWGIPKMDGL